MFNFLIILLNITLGSELNSHFCIQNFNLKICPISENEIIFYGTDGGILRTYDGGDTWHQNFSGTHSNIKKIIKIENTLYGVTENGFLMISTDKGNYWNYFKVDSSLVDLISFNDSLLIFSENQKVYFFDINNKNILRYITTPQKVSQTCLINNDLYIITVLNEIYKINKNMTNWENIELPEISNFNINFNFGYIYLYNREFISILKNLRWETYSISNLLNIYSYHTQNYIFLLDEKNFLIFNNLNTAISPKININSYDIESQKDYIIDSLLLGLKEIGLHFNDSKINDIRKIGNYYYITMRSKIILKTKDFKIYETIYYFPHNAFNISNSSFEFISKNKLLFLDINNTQNVIRKGNNFISKSNNKGISFENFVIKDTIEEKLNIQWSQFDSVYIFRPYFGNLYCKDSLEYILEAQGGIRLDYKGEFFSSRIKYFKTNDGGKTFNEISTLSKLSSLRGIPMQNDFGLIENHNSLYYFFKFEIIQSKSLKNAFDIYLDSIREHKIYIVDNNDHLDSIKVLYDSLNNFNFYIDSNYIWFYGNRITSYFEIIDSLNNMTRKNYKNTGGATYQYNRLNKSWKLLKEENIPVIFKSINGNYYQFVENKMIECNEDLEIINIFHLEFNSIHLFKGESNRVGFLEEKIFQVNKDDKTYLIKFDLDNPYLFDKIDIEYSPDLYLAKDKKSIYYIKNQRLLYIPIEPERLQYYASSVERGSPPPIWTYPPYPNPVKDRLKMKFYSAMMAEIAKLKVELIHIGTGRSYQIEKYDLNILDDYWGEIEIDVSGYIRGAYLINFKLGDGNKSESIIIE